MCVVQTRYGGVVLGCSHCLRALSVGCRYHREVEIMMGLRQARNGPPW